MSVITVSFARLMIQERQQALDDELSKSAYNAALSGVEDAKRAIVYCNSLNDPTERQRCEEALYASTCPGFNAANYFQDKLGIAQSENNKTSLVLNETDSSVQGYSCVVVSGITASLKGSLSASESNGGALFRIQTTAPYDRIKIEWKGGDSAKYYEKSAWFSGVGDNGTNARSPQMNGYQTALRLMTFSVPGGSFSRDDINSTQQSYFVYPVIGSSSSDIRPWYVTRRYAKQCDATADSGYPCSVIIRYASSFDTPADQAQWYDKYNTVSRTQYVALNSIYTNADYQITAYNGDEQVSFSGVQMTIDSTGYASGVYRRVLVNVRLGGQGLTTANAVDTGLGLCKNFTVDSSGFENLATNNSNGTGGLACPPL